MHTVVGEPAGDIHGHGTLIAGLALFGPLDKALLTNNDVRLRHRLESVKFLPDQGKTTHDPLAYGIVTAEAVAVPPQALRADRATPLGGVASRTRCTHRRDGSNRSRLDRVARVESSPATSVRREEGAASSPSRDAQSDALWTGTG